MIIISQKLDSMESQMIVLPLGSQLLSIQKENDDVRLYALVNPVEDRKETYDIQGIKVGEIVKVNLSSYQFLNSVSAAKGHANVIHFFYKRVV